MCGIAGLWSASSLAQSTAHDWLRNMADTLVHRGPDGSGMFFDRDAGIGFAHRRLSIVDLSDRGQQPMWSSSGRYCISYNGEIYNAPELRSELDQWGLRTSWRGHSDTEVMLEVIEALGLEKALERFRGMFAFALWDARQRHLSLVRDRLGIKPLVYVQGSFGIAFSSELQALYAIPPFEPRLDRSALASFLRYGVVPGDECIIADVSKVQPGTVVSFTEPRKAAAHHVYWSPRQLVSDGARKPFEGSVHDAVDELEQRLRDSVALRMRSDVPLGAFLSGGIDSSVVVATMQQSASTQTKTFCIGNAVADYDESAHAEAVARHLGCEHHTLVADPGDMLSIVPDIAHFWDEPFADSSQIPTFMVSRLTRRHVTVSLSGDGGDELFGGYNRHRWAPLLWRAASYLPRAARRALAAPRKISVEDWDRAAGVLGLGDSIRLAGDKAHKLGALADADSLHDFYERLRSHWIDPPLVSTGSAARLGARARTTLDIPPPAQLMFYDMVEYLPDDILAKVDRASMAVSLEARVPLLDHEVVELAWRFPLSWKIHGRTTKWILRQVLARHVPVRLFDRPKTGFGVPVGRWLRGPLASWGADLLDPKSLRADGILDPDIAAETWRAHQLGRGNHEHRLWALLMFQSWWAKNRKHVRAF